MAAGGYKEFVAGEVLDEDDINDYLMQGVLVFAGTAARGSAITAPVEGQFAFLKDSDQLTYHDGSQWTELSTTPGAAVVSGTTGSPTLGTVSSGGTTYNVYSFTGSGSIIISEAGFAEVLMVGAGGGGGGSLGGGGGGAGEYVAIASSFLAVGTATITVGGGGAGGANDIRGTTGNPVMLRQLGALGGGGGNGGPQAGFYGPSTGGGNGDNPGVGAVTARITFVGLGNLGGVGAEEGFGARSGGGGGSGSVGQAFQASASGNGGSGTSNSITGSAVDYAGGGGGGKNGGTAGTGQAGGGNGSNSGAAGGNGTANRGSGGGGGGNASTGGNGSSGVVIVRVAV
jgi:hypothetical protein